MPQICAFGVSVSVWVICSSTATGGLGNVTPASRTSGRKERRPRDCAAPPPAPRIFAYSGFLAQGYSYARVPPVCANLSIWRAAVLFPSGISGRPGAAVMVRLLIVRKERDAPGSPARGIDRGETAAQVLSLCPSVCTIRDELPRLYSYSPETPARVCERLRVFCGVPSLPFLP